MRRRFTDAPRLDRSGSSGMREGIKGMLELLLGRQRRLSGDFCNELARSGQLRVISEILA